MGTTWPLPRSALTSSSVPSAVNLGQRWRETASGRRERGRWGERVKKMQEQGGFALSLSDLDILNVLVQEEFLSTFTGEMTSKINKLWY